MLAIAKMEWRKALSGIPNHSIERAINESSKVFEWPPSIAEFIKLCNRSGEAAYMPESCLVALPDNVSTEESKKKAGEAREKIRQICGLNRK